MGTKECLDCREYQKAMVEARRQRDEASTYSAYQDLGHYEDKIRIAKALGIYVGAKSWRGVNSTRQDEIILERIAKLERRTG